MHSAIFAIVKKRQATRQNIQKDMPAYRKKGQATFLADEARGAVK
jgi:hypothetical protein